MPELRQVRAAAAARPAGPGGGRRCPGHRGRLAAALLGCCAVLLAACSAGHAPDRLSRTGAATASGAPVKLGLLLPLTGESRSTGAAMQVASAMAVDNENAAGGVHGRRIELVTMDDACDPQTSVLAANAMVDQHVAVSVGGYCSGATLPTLAVFRRAGIPMVLPASNSDDLLEPGYDSVFLLSGTSNQEAGAALRWMGKLGVSRVALVHDGTSYSVNIATRGADLLRHPYDVPAPEQPPAGLRLATVVRLTQGALRHTQATAAVLASKADAVYFTGYTPEAGRLTRDLRLAGYRGIIMVADGSVDPAMLTFAEGKAEGVYATMVPLAQNLPLPAAWTQEYRRRAGTGPGPFTVQAYDAVTLAVDALRRAGTGDGRAIAHAIATTQGLQLLAGPATFAANGTLSGFRFNLLQVRAGRFTLVAADPRAAGSATPAPAGSATPTPAGS